MAFIYYCLLLATLVDEEKLAYDYLSHIPNEIKKNSVFKSSFAGLLYEIKPPLVYIKFLEKKMDFLQAPSKYEDVLILFVFNEL